MADKHIRFRSSLDAYKEGESHLLPEDLANMYLNAGIAEVVDYVFTRDGVAKEHKGRERGRKKDKGDKGKDAPDAATGDDLIAPAEDKAAPKPSPKTDDPKPSPKPAPKPAPKPEPKDSDEVPPDQPEEMTPEFGPKGK